MSRTVSVVSHTHWDREWYAPFEAYRLRLVQMMDGLLDLLEEDDRFPHFHLDGQVSLIDDFLEVRPEAEPRLRALIAAGRLSIGPWYVLMDEFCVSGETIVRNLQLGLERTGDLGAEPAVGYLPDMFGHIAQMPQILHSAGLAYAVVWRGVPAAVDRSGFWWEGPDGSRVRAEYLPVGYANGAFLPTDSGALVRRTEAHEREVEGFLGPDWPMLMMNGGDHHDPQAAVPDVLEKANGEQDRYFFRHITLAEHCRSAPHHGLPVWRGELRSSHRAPILMGVLSNRVDLKQAAAAAEEALEKRAEPLAALWLPADLWPAELDRAWLEVIRNSAHDSICGCSADEVGRAVHLRYDTAGVLAAEATGRSLAIAAVALSATGPAVVNPLPFSRNGLVELTVPGTVPPPGTQQLDRVAPGRREVSGRGRDMGAMLAELTDGGWLGPTNRVVAASLTDPGQPLVVTLDHDPTRPLDRLLASTLAEARARAGADSDEPLTVVARRGSWQRVLAPVADVPGWGWSTLNPGAVGPRPVTVAEGDPVSLDNGLVGVEVDPSSGTFALNGVAGQNRLVEEPDVGDSYNFAPVPGAESVADPEDVTVEVLEHGPLRARVRVRRHYRWPAGPGCPRPELTEVVSDVEVRAGEPLVRVTTSFDNRTGDHRVRAVFPLPAPAGGSVAECAFATVPRGLEGEGGAQESPLPTFPSRRFVTAGRLTLTHRGLLEYELLSGGSALALTLVRATGIISRPTISTRPNVAGPPLPLRDAQMLGPVALEYALAPDCSDPFRMTDQVWTPLLAISAGGHGHLPDRGSRLEVDQGRCVVSSLRRRSGAIELRVYNPTDAGSRVALAGHSGWLIDLRGRRLRRFDGHFEVRPGAIVTARLDARSLDRPGSTRT